jgi:hypothetical protein
MSTGRRGCWQTQQHQRMQGPLCHGGAAVGISRRLYFLFAQHAESLVADTAGPSAAARSASVILDGLHRHYNKAKVCQFVGFGRRLAGNIQTGFENRRRTPLRQLSPDTI